MKKGFTLVELMIVVAIFAVVLAIIIPIAESHLWHTPDKVIFKAVVSFHGQDQYWLFVDHKGLGQWQLVDEVVYNSHQVSEQ